MVCAHIELVFFPGGYLDFKIVGYFERPWKYFSRVASRVLFPDYIAIFVSQNISRQKPEYKALKKIDLFAGARRQRRGRCSGKRLVQ